MLKNSLVTTLLSTGISILLSFALAFLLNRSLIRFKSVFVVLFTLPMLIPSISHGQGLVLLSFVKQYPIDLSFSLETVRRLLSGGMGMYFVNSMAVSLLTALLGTCLSYFAAFVTARGGKSVSNRMIHFISIMSPAIPGIVLGLSFVLTFRPLPIYTTIFILVLVNIVHFFSSPYLLAVNSLSKFNHNLEDVADSLGISRMRMLWNVYIPCTRVTIVEMYSYYFVNAMITISAVSFLVKFRTMPLSLLIPQLESQSFLEGTALVSLMILLLNLTEKGVAFCVNRAVQKEDRMNGTVLEQLREIEH